jgi:DNA-binding PucR family transcriptional regulator
MQLDAFTGCGVLTGNAGLSNEIRWVNILEILDDLRYIEEGEFLITTAYGFDFRDTEKQERLMELLAGNKLAALAVQTGHYIVEVPDTLINLADRHKIPLIEIPSDTSFKNLTKALMGELTRQDINLHDDPPQRNSGVQSLLRQNRILMQKLIAGENAEGLRDVLRSMRISPFADFFLVVFNTAPVFEIDNVSTAQLSPEDSDKLEQSLFYLLAQQKMPFLLGLTDMNPIVLIQPPEGMAEQASVQIRRLIDEITQLCPRFEFTAGMSRRHNRLEEINHALAEARRALEAAALELTGDSRLIHYDCLGLYRLLLEVENLSTLMSTVDDTIGPLLKYDRRTGGALITTLNSYLKHLNISAAAEELYVHRHTLRYRLRQIEEMTRLNLDNAEHIFQLYMARKIYDYLKARKLT